MPKKPRKPKLPILLSRKIYKTGQTRGADDDVIYQNRVGRNSTVLIPFEFIISEENRWALDFEYENGYIVLISPDDYYGESASETIKIMNESGLMLGENALLFYTQRYQYNQYNPQINGISQSEPMSRKAPLGGEIVCRIAATTSSYQGEKINKGYNTTQSKGAGIRLYEYANSAVIEKCRIQLEAIYWLCADSLESAALNEMSPENALKRRDLVLAEAEALGLLDKRLLREKRIIDEEDHSVCPLCLAKLSAKGFFSRLEQQEFRQVHDLTVTEINLFHINELRYGAFNHKPYNLGWGHHHCNVVVKDSGIDNTLVWMSEVIERNLRLDAATKSDAT